MVCVRRAQRASSAVAIRAARCGRHGALRLFAHRRGRARYAHDRARAELLRRGDALVVPDVHPQVSALWEWLVDIVAGVGVVLAATGLWIGWLRWKRRPKPGKLHVPYGGLMRW